MKTMGLLTMAALTGAASAVALPAQSIERQVSNVTDGRVRISFAARDGVCGDGHNIQFNGAWDSSEDWTSNCEPGPIRVQFDKSNNRITRIRTYVGGLWRDRPNVTDLGMVDPSEAAEYLLDLAETGPASVADDAIMPALAADAPDPWRRLLAMARNRDLHEEVRHDAIFWLSQSASARALSELVDIAESTEEETRIQKRAVFALSQMDSQDAIPHLIRIARQHRNPEVVRSALFWLADSEDERAVDLFEEILTDG